MSNRTPYDKTCNSGKMGYAYPAIGKQGRAINLLGPGKRFGWAYRQTEKSYNWLYRKLQSHLGEQWDKVQADLLKADCDNIIASMLSRFVEQNVTPECGFVFRGVAYWELSNNELFVSPSGRLLSYERMPWPKPTAYVKQYGHKHMPGYCYEYCPISNNWYRLHYGKVQDTSWRWSSELGGYVQHKVVVLRQLEKQAFNKQELKQFYIDYPDAYRHDMQYVLPNAQLIGELMPGKQYAKLRSRTLLRYRNTEISKPEFALICRELIQIADARMEQYA